MEAKVLTVLQQRILSCLFANGLGERGYYFTDGSTLGEFYLQHRYSDDLGIFTRSARPFKPDIAYYNQVLTSEGYDIVFSDESDEFIGFFVQTIPQAGESLKVELARDAKAQMSPSKVFGKIVVDSFEDIAVNKICAIFGREPSEPKDFVDLFFILKESEFTVDYLLERAKEKEAAFDREDGILIFATNLLRVKDLSIMPRMIKLLSMEDLRSTLIPKAEAMIRRLRPGRS